MKRNITFDTNVWRRLDNEEKPHLVEIKNKIQDGKIQPYICEIALVLEAIQRILRPEFFENYKPRMTGEDLPPENGKLRILASIAPNTELHPGLPAVLKADLLKARDLGFRVLRMAHLGTVRTTEIPDDMYVKNANINEFWEYANLMAKCSDYITGLGCGQSDYNQFKEEYNLVGSVVSESHTIPVEHRERFARAIAEWADGDSLAAHYATGNDFFCTNDTARKAGTGSIFYDQNRAQLEKAFGIKIISSCEAAQL